MDDRFRPALSPVAAEPSMVRGEHFRITVLTAGLLRLEYSPDGEFEDRASAFAWHRSLPVPDFRVADGVSLEIITDRLHLTYDRSAFSTSGLSIQISGGVTNYHSVWRPGGTEKIVGNLGGTARTLDLADGAIPLEPGVASRNGFAVLDDSRTPVLEPDGWVSPRDGTRTDLYFFGYGHDYADAVRALYAVSGPTPVLPRWALGNWWSRYHPYTADEYLALMDRFAAERIPFSVAVLDMDWHPVADVDPKYGSGWTGYSWNRALFPDPPAFLASLHSRGLRTTLNVHPADGVRAFEDAYPDVARALGRDPATGDPIPFDITDPDFLTAYFDALHHPREDEGVDFWWLDWQSGPYSRVAGIDRLWMLNHFHFLDSSRAGRRGLTFSRYAGPGSHRYPVGFSGDTVVSWESLDFQPEFTATASNIGYGWWSHDVGGHMFGYKDDELATRWVQLGVFSPILRLHSTLDAFNSKEPWRFPPAAHEAMADALRFRHRLIPYLHTMNHRAARDGAPLVQPLYWSYPEQPETYRLRNQFTFGTQLLVAPITSPAQKTTLLGATTAWLPAGDWVDVFTGLRYAGGREITLHRNGSSIPVLAPAGAIIPLDAAALPGNGADLPSALEIWIVPGADGAFELIEDEGTGSGLDESGVARTPISYSDGEVRIGPVSRAIDGLPENRSWTVTLLGATAVAHGEHGSSWTMTDAPVGTAATLRLLDLQLTENDVITRIFDLLDAAQISFADKRRAHGVATSSAPLAVRMSHLLALDLARPVLDAVAEILLA